MQRFNLGGEKVPGSDPADHGHVTSAGGLTEAGEGLLELREDDGGEPLRLNIWFI